MGDMWGRWPAFFCFAVLVAGCLGGSTSGTSKWIEPGLYDQLATLQGSPPPGYSITRIAPPDSLFPGESEPDLDGATPQSVSDGTWFLGRSGKGGGPSITLGTDPPGFQVRGSGADAIRASFTAFARQIVVADDAALARMADEYVAGLSRAGNDQRNNPWLAVTHPLTFSTIEAALGTAPTVRRSEYSTQFERVGGGFEVRYSVPMREMRGTEDYRYHALHVAPDDLTFFEYKRHANQPLIRLNETRSPPLALFMEALGRPVPANITYWHGD